jgi:NADH-quinone oxidoreductase subunit J
VSAVAVVTLPNVVHAAFSLMVTLFSVAGLYVFLQADFLAATQVIVYVGGILVLILFGVLMTSSKLVMKVNIEVSKWQMFGGIIVSSALFVVLSLLTFETPWNVLSEVVNSSDSTVEQIGIAILQKKFLLPFEVASIILLIALIGAVFISRTEEQE